MEQLTVRESVILRSVVQNFINSAVPVGSRAIAKSSNLNVCPATIRNVMMDLEEKGYLTQPHTSAGRVPTDKGYRFYVDGLMKLERLSFPERKVIQENLKNLSKDVNIILEKSSEVLAKISNLLGVVLSPRFYQGIFEKLELVSLSEKKVLVVISIRSGLVKTIIMEIHTEISRDKLEETAKILNERLYGLSLREIKQSIDRRMKDVAEGDVDLIKLFVSSKDRLFDFDEEESFHFGGTHNIMAQPEFYDQKNMKKILELIENKKILIHILDKRGDTEKISITIGEENREELIKNCSLVTTTYQIGDVTGTLGVIGPTRMRYSKMVSLVDYIAKEITAILTEP